MKLFRAISAISAIAMSALSVAPAISQTALTVVKDAEGSVYVRGLGANSPTEFIFSNVQTTRNTVSNACGGVILRGSTSQPLPSQLTVGGGSITVGDLPVALLPTCVSGAWQIEPTGNFRTPDGRVVIVGQTPNTAIPVGFTGDRVRSATANSCGLVRLRSSNSFTVGGSFTVAGSSFTVADLQVKNAPLCRSGITYLAVE
jgi:hypothetical protein